MEHSLWNPLNQEDWKQLLTHLFLVHNYDPSTFPGIAGAFWSLAIEAQLYLLYPALLVLVAKLGWRRTMVILAGCELLIRGMDGLMQTVGAANTIGGHISGGFARSPLGFWFSWALGAFIADGFLKKQKLPFIKTSPVWWLSMAILCYFIKPLYPLRFLLFAVVTAAVASKLLSGARPKINVPPFSMDILRKTGLWSYSIYLLHQPLLNIYSHIIVWAVPGEYRSAPITFVLILATWLVIIPFSILWHRLFELPGIAFGKRIIQNIYIPFGTKAVPERLPRNGQVWMVKTRYYLMIATLLILVFGSFLVVAKLIPREPVENNNLAWLLATSPEAAKRNGALAVTLAEDACQRTQYQQTAMVGTLAAAYAEAGRFDEAILAGQKACALAEKNGETNLLQENQELLVLYQNHQPYRDHQAGTRK